MIMLPEPCDATMWWCNDGTMLFVHIWLRTTSFLKWNLIKLEGDGKHLGLIITIFCGTLWSHLIHLVMFSSQAQARQATEQVPLGRCKHDTFISYDVSYMCDLHVSRQPRQPNIRKGAHSRTKNFWRKLAHNWHITHLGSRHGMK